MKSLFFSGLLTLALVRLASAQSSVYENDGPFNSPPSDPPQIDATNFINKGQFNIGLNNFTSVKTTVLNGAILATSIAPFDFSDVLYFTNRGSMQCDTGFTFDTAPSGAGTAHMAASFGNSNLGLVTGGSVTNSFTSAFVFFLGAGAIGSGGIGTGLPSVNVWATNVVNTGILDVGVTGIINVTGNRLDLTHGTLHVEGFDDFAASGILGAGLTNAAGASNLLIALSNPDLGIFNSLYGVGLQTNLLSLGSFTLPSPGSPFSLVTNEVGVPTSLFVAPPNATPFVFTNKINASNFTYQVVFINTNLPGIATDVRFEFGFPGQGFAIPVVQWSAVITNNVGLPTVTNFLYLSDQFGFFPTNLIFTNSFSFSNIPQIAPYNYSFSRVFLDYASLPTNNFAPYNAQSIFANAFPETNAYSAYEVNVLPVSFAPDISAVASPVNKLPGRVQITASNWVDLTRSKITGPNYLNLSATNHFNGSTNALIVAPNMDINVGSTNGILNINGLVAPFVPRFTGVIDMWAGRWTNIVGGVTNAYHVLIVNSGLSPTSAVSVLNFTARSTNVVINDSLNVVSNLLIQAQNLTIASNPPTAANPIGVLNLSTPDIVWSSSFPILQNLTNYGTINLSNTVYFEGIRQNPYYPSNFDEPYISLVNHGSIFTGGNNSWAIYLENTSSGNATSNAIISSSAGPINLQAGTAVLTNGSILAPAGDLSISVSNLTIINHLLQTSGALSFSVSNSLTDGGAASSNFWMAGDGMNLLVKPVTGDFLGTTVTLTAPPGLDVPNTWAGLDKGPVESGFLNNGAMGHLILNGGDIFSQFSFGGPDATNHYAIYVDQLELQNGATNRADESGTEFFTAFDVAPNFIIYFADAVIGTFDISEKLNGADGGSLIWVPSYAGIFSSTNLVYPVGVTNKLNRALVTSTDIDSNGNGVANAFDSMPIYTSYDVNLTISFTNLPPKVPVLKWSGLANSTNIVYFKTGLTSTNWTVLTNFVYGPANGIATVIDRGRTNSSAYYKVQVIAAQP